MSLSTLRLTGRLEAVEPHHIQEARFPPHQLIGLCQEVGPIRTLRQWQNGYLLYQQLRKEMSRDDSEAEQARAQIEQKLFMFCRNRAQEKLTPEVRPIAKYTLWHRYWPQTDNALLLKLLDYEDVLRIDRKGRLVVLGFHLGLGTMDFQYDSQGQRYRLYKRCFCPQAFIAQPRFQEALKYITVNPAPLDQNIYKIFRVAPDRRNQAQISMSRDDKQFIRQEFVR